MAPSRPAARSTDRRAADVFGLGAILCEILDRPAAVRRAHARRDPRPGRARRPGRRLSRLDACGADAELVGLARDCLAAEPAARPRTPGEVGAA